MTAQAPDSILLANGACHSLCVLPLESLFKAMPSQPRFRSPTTANWRGYRASWKIEDNLLWLVGLAGELEGRSYPQAEDFACESNHSIHPRELHIAHIRRIESLTRSSNGMCQSDRHWRGVPDDNGFVDPATANTIKIETLLDSGVNPVPASWYSGILRIPMGSQLEYVHGGFLSEYETDLVIEVEGGTIVRQWLVDNKPGYEAREREKELGEKSMLALATGFDRTDESRHRDAISRPLDSAAHRVTASFRLFPGLPLHHNYRHYENALDESIAFFTRSHFLGQAKGSAEMSPQDQTARAAFEKANAAFAETQFVTRSGISLRAEEDAGRNITKYERRDLKRASALFETLDIPSSASGQLEWSIEKIRRAEHLVATEQFEILGAAYGIAVELANSFLSPLDPDRMSSEGKN